VKKKTMQNRDIIVIGASAGGFEAIRRLVAGLPAGLPASLFIVWHMAPAVKSILPEILNRLMTLTAGHATCNFAGRGTRTSAPRPMTTSERGGYPK